VTVEKEQRRAGAVRPVTAPAATRGLFSSEPRGVGELRQSFRQTLLVAEPLFAQLGRRVGHYTDDERAASAP
jgi:hypothetical protein